MLTKAIKRLARKTKNKWFCNFLGKKAVYLIFLWLSYVQVEVKKFLIGEKNNLQKNTISCPVLNKIFDPFKKVLTQFHMFLKTKNYKYKNIFSRECLRKNLSIYFREISCSAKCLKWCIHISAALIAVGLCNAHCETVVRTFLISARSLQSSIVTSAILSRKDE